MLADTVSDEIEKDFYYFCSDKYMDVNVEVESLFEEDKMTIGSSVSRITSNKWE
ncbi:MAG: hypothetical protein MUC95_02055 [Spirochaetes bacterium]|nr:hypothetical protein [Spirochaetota bacterium]